MTMSLKNEWLLNSKARHTSFESMLETQSIVTVRKKNSGQQKSQSLVGGFNYISNNIYKITKSYEWGIDKSHKSHHQL